MKYLKNIFCTSFIFIWLLTMAGSSVSSTVVATTAVPKLPDIVQEVDVAEKQTPIEKTPAKEIKEDARKITMSFVGDCMIATAKGRTNLVGSFNWTAEREDASYFFEKVADIFLNDDFTVVNCENVFTDSAFTRVAKGKPAYWYRTATKNSKVFGSGGVDIVSVANNHANDYGKIGFSDTVKALENVGMEVGNNYRPVIVEKYGIRIGVICCDIWCYGHYSRTVDQIKKIESDTDIQIVYFHGGREMIHKPEEWKISAAKKIVDAGADLVIGGHPHVLQPLEIYKDVPIVYSLGNFVYGGNNKPENRTIIYQATFEVREDKVSVTSDIIPCYVYTGKTNNWQPDIITDESDKNKVLDFMNGHRKSPY